MNEYLQYESRIIGCILPVDDYNTLLACAGSTENRTNIVHVVQAGEYLHKIAMKYSCTIENLKAWNNLNGNSLYPGQVLSIWINPVKGN
jgi:membrane-bound lytic murein transglycosylase D